MRAVAKFAMRSPTAASSAAAAYAIFAAIFPPFVVVSGAIIALATLRSGFTKGTQVTALASLICGVGYYIVLKQPSTAFLTAMCWIPALAAANVLRASESQGAALSLCAVFTAIYAVLVRALVPELEEQLEAQLQERLVEFAGTVTDQGGTFLDASELSQISGAIYEGTVATVCVYCVCSILLARWWQAELFNPGGFGREFREIVVPRVASSVAAVVAVFALVQGASGEISGIASDLLIVAVVLFAFQGLALIHHRMRELTLDKAWLIGLYVLLVLMPHRIGLMLAIAGIADTVLDVRKLRRS